MTLSEVLLGISHIGVSSISSSTCIQVDTPGSRGERYKKIRSPKLIWETLSLALLGSELPVPAVVGIWKMNHQIGDYSLSLYFIWSKKYEAQADKGLVSKDHKVLLWKAMHDFLKLNQNEHCYNSAALPSFCYTLIL